MKYKNKLKLISYSYEVLNDKNLLKYEAEFMNHNLIIVSQQDISTMNALSLLEWLLFRRPGHHCRLQLSDEDLHLIS